MKFEIDLNKASEDLLEKFLQLIKNSKNVWTLGSLLKELKISHAGNNFAKLRAAMLRNLDGIRLVGKINKKYISDSVSEEEQGIHRGKGHGVDWDVLGKQAAQFIRSSENMLTTKDILKKLGLSLAGQNSVKLKEVISNNLYGIRLLVKASVQDNEGLSAIIFLAIEVTYLPLSDIYCLLASEI